MAKLPTKGEGVTTTERGFPIHCESTGEFKGKTNYGWKHSDGSAVFKKINGSIEFIEPSGSVPSTVNEAVVPLWGSVTLTEVDKNLVSAESRLCSIAAGIAKDRYPGMKETSQTFGMIVNAIKGSLIALEK